MTQSYYDVHAKEYAELTVKADMSPAYDRFLAYLPAGAGILDAGCGSGRDSLCFIKKGYDVTMLDASAGMCRCAETLTGRRALCMKFDEIEFADRFDGIWACASLLHVSEKELENVLAKFHRALKRDGVLYASWKYGETERSDGERFYCDMTEEKLQNVLARLGLFDCLDCWVAEDSLPSGREQKWLNVVLGKKTMEIPNNVPKHHRGRYGIFGGSNRSGDFNRYLFLAKTHDYVLFFTNKGQAYMLRGYQIPEAGRKAKGSAVINLLQLSPDEKITAVLNVPGFEDKKYLFMATNKGTVKRCKLTDFSSVRKNGLKAVVLNDGEELISVKITDGSNSILLATHDGMAIHFDEQDVRCMSRAAHGVKGISLHDGDYVVAMDVVYDESLDVLSVTENGIGKRTKISEYKKQSRGGKGRISYRLSPKTGSVTGMCIVHPDDELFLFTAKGYVLCVDADELKNCGRFARGVIAMRLHDGDKVTSICKANRGKKQLKNSSSD